MNSSIITMALTALCGWLGWMAYEQAVKPVPTTTPPARRDAAAPARDNGKSGQRGKTAEFPALDTLDDIVSRPLFNVSRRPIVVESPTPEVKPSELNVMLSGIVIGRTEQIAHLRSATDKETRALHVGDKIDGWQIESIFPDRVVLKSGGRVETLYMQKPGEAGPKANSRRTRTPYRQKGLQNYRRPQPRGGR